MEMGLMALEAGLSATAPVRRILALGGHEFSSRPPDRAVCELLLRLAGERGGERPRICILPTASGDTSDQIASFYSAFGERRCEPSDVSLFRLGRRPMALRDHLLAQDLIYVGGGSLLNLLAVWEAHDVASMLSLARRAAYLEAVGDGMPGGYGLDDYAGLLWEGEGTPSALTARRGARAYRVSNREGAVAESPLPARFLPAPAPAALREDIAEFRRIKTMRKRAGWLS
jgi:dipeptidase E